MSSNLITASIKKKTKTMNKLLNGFNNGRNTSDGIGGKTFQEINGNSSIKTKTMNKYIVINSEDIQKRIDDLKKDILISESQGDKTRAAIETFEMKAYEEILSKSKPLTPIIENALKEGMLIQRTINDKVKIPATRIKDYINNLKLDI